IYLSSNIIDSLSKNPNNIPMLKYYNLEKKHEPKKTPFFIPATSSVLPATSSVLPVTSSVIPKKKKVEKKEGKEIDEDLDDEFDELPNVLYERIPTFSKFLIEQKAIEEYEEYEKEKFIYIKFELEGKSREGYFENTGIWFKYEPTTAN